MLRVLEKDAGRKHSREPLKLFFEPFFNNGSWTLNVLLSDLDWCHGEDLPSRLQERRQRGGLPPLLVPDHLGENLERLLPPQRSELAILKLCTHRHAWQDGDTHARGHALGTNRAASGWQL